MDAKIFTELALQLKAQTHVAKLLVAINPLVYVQMEVAMVLKQFKKLLETVQIKKVPAQAVLAAGQ